MVLHKLKGKALATSIACALALSMAPTYNAVAYAAEADSEQQQKTGETAKDADYAQTQEEYQLPTVTVEAPRPEWESKLSPGTVSIVRPEDFKGEQKTLPELLKRVPGVHIREVTGTGQYTVVSVRGSTAAQVGIFVDGVLTKLGGDAATDLSTIPVENVERIEIYRGYIPARFPGAWIGGVINIVTKKPQNTGFSLSQGMSSYGGYTGSLGVNAPLGGGSLFVGVNRDQSQGDFKYNFPGTDIYRHRLNNGYQNTDVLVKWQDENWQVKYAWKRNYRELPYNVLNENYDLPSYWGSKQPSKKLNTDQSDLLIGRRQTDGNLEWGWRLTYMDQDKNYKNPWGNNTIFAKWSHYQSQRFGGSLDGSFKAGDAHLLEFMANYSHERLDVDGAAMTSPSYAWVKDHYTQTLADIQLQDTITLNKKGDFWFTPSVHWNYSGGMGEAKSNYLWWVTAMQENADSKFTWQTALKKQLNEQTTLRATYGTYYRFPNLYELIGDGAFILPVPPSSTVAGAAGPEHGRQWDLGIQWHGETFKAKSDWALTYFGRHSYDMLELYRMGLTYMSYVNGGEGRVNGVELEGKLNWDRWDLDLSATYMQSKDLQRIKKMYYLYPNGNYGKSLENFAPKWEGLLRLTYRFPGERLSLFNEIRYVGETNVDDEVDWNTSYTTVGLGAKYKFSKDTRLTVGVNNMFNKVPYWKTLYTGTGYDPYYYYGTMKYPLAGRTYYATVQWDF
ncbi:TonB-dependent receptor plug domain-containing protein [Sporomusa aerivorans]|uniref:TonB-dependent receptor plug domain-containing protein n=1 Tax=Sporomusa aerivorans TaxID=204936 RepID=UPI003529E862